MSGVRTVKKGGVTLERFLVGQDYEWKHLLVGFEEEQRTQLSTVVVFVFVAVN